jgi:glucose/arabinose dehydrogenase
MIRIVVAILLFPVIVAAAATFPSGFKSAKIANVNKPTAMGVAPDGRVFVCEQTGKVRVIKNDVLLSQPFLSIPVHSQGEHGLLGIAFDPSFSSNKRVYVFYTPNGTTARISRFTAQGDVAASGSELVVFTISGLSGQNRHTGGSLGFSPVDGKLYIALGDNASRNNAQSLSNLFGKVLRINKDGSIPGDNPFYNQASGINRAIYSLGLRNPFSFAFQRGSSNRMHINDVGETKFEEINNLAKGANFGWPLKDGPNNCGANGHKCPMYYYQHGTGNNSGCAVVGSTFYDPFVLQFPTDYKNDYFFDDLCNGWIKRLDITTGAVSTFAQGINQPVALAVDRNTGKLYYAQRGATSGAVVKVTF